MAYTPGGMFPYIEGQLTEIQQPLQDFQRRVETAVLAASGGGGFGIPDPAASGIVVRTGLGTSVARSLTQPGAGITIANANGTGGNPTFALADDLAALEGLATTGFAKRTGTSAWSTVASVSLSSDVSGSLPWASVSKTGSSLLDLATRSAADLSSGTLADARFPATLPALSGVNLTNLTASNVASGTLADARLSSNVPLKNAANIFTNTNQFDYIGVWGATPDSVAGIKIAKTGMPGGTNGVNISIAGTTDADVVWRAGIVQTIWSGTGSSNHPNAETWSQWVTHSGSGRLDVATASWSGIVNSGGGILQEPGAFRGQIANYSGTIGQSYLFDADFVMSGTSNVSTYAALFRGRFRHLNNAGTKTTAAVYGMFFTLWDKPVGTVTYSSILEVDTSVDIGTARWMIHSTSTSPSLLSGDLTNTGLLKAGTTPVTLTTVAGKIILSAIDASTGGLTNSFVPRRSGSTLVDSQITDDGTFVRIMSSGSGFLSAGRVTKLGDIQGAFNAVTLTVDDSAGEVQLQGALNMLGYSVVGTGHVLSMTAGGYNIGSPALPYASVYIGGATTNNIRLIGTATAARVATFPDATTKIPVAPQLITVAGMTAGWTWTVPDATFSLARIDAAQTFVGVQTFSGSISVPLLNAAADLTMSPTGSVVVNAGSKLLQPLIGYDQNIGQLSRKFLTLHAAELWVETLVAQNTIATIGGRIIVAPTTTLTADIGTGATSIVVKHNQMVSGDRVLFEANGSVEFMAITSGPTGSGPYTYSVTRNLDGTGANAWTAGDAVLNTGTTGNGFLDLYSFSSQRSAGQVTAGVTPSGPTIVGNVRNSATFNDWSEHWAIGNLTGLYGYGANVYGVAFGQYAAGKAHLTLDSTNGIRIFSGVSTVIGQWSALGVITVGEVAAAKSNLVLSSGVLQVRLNTTVLGQWDTSGNITVGQVAAGQSNVLISSGVLDLRVNTAIRTHLAADGSGYFANSLFSFDTSGNVTIAGNAVIGGVTIGSGKMYVGTGTFNNTNTGFYVDSTGQFSLKDKLSWNGTTLTITGGGTFSGALSAATGTFSGSLSAATGTFAGSLSAATGTFAGGLTAGSGTITGDLTIGSGGVLRSVATAVLTGNGYWLDYNAGTPRFRIGTVSAGALLKGMYWDGSTLIWTATNSSLNSSGNLIVTGGTIGGWTLSATAISSTGINIASGGSAYLAFGATPPTSASSSTGLFLDSTGLYAINASVNNVSLTSSGLQIRTATGVGNPIEWFSAGTSIGQVYIQGSATNSSGAMYSVGSGSGQASLVSARGLTQRADLFIRSDSTGSWAQIYGNTGVFNGFLVGGLSGNTATAMLDVRGTATATRIGIGVAPHATDPLRIEGNSTGGIQSTVQNTNAAGNTSFLTMNDLFNLIQMGVYGSTRTAYGAIGTGSAYVYASTDLTLMSDGGALKFASGGNAARMTLSAAGGLTIGAPTGGDKGAGTINAVAVWRNGTSLDSVFQPGYKLIPLDQLGDFIHAHNHLPTIPTNEVNVAGSTNMGALTDRLWETTENHALYILQLNDRIKELEAEIKVLRGVK